MFLGRAIEVSDYKEQQRMKRYTKKLRKDLLIKSVVIPLAFIVITIITCLVLSDPNLKIFPNSDNSENLDKSYSDVQPNVQSENENFIRGLKKQNG